MAPLRLGIAVVCLAVAAGVFALHIGGARHGMPAPTTSAPASAPGIPEAPGARDAVALGNDGTVAFGGTDLLRVGAVCIALLALGVSAITAALRTRRPGRRISPPSMLHLPHRITIRSRAGPAHADHLAFSLRR